MKLYAFRNIKALKDWDNGHLVVMAENEEEMIKIVRETAQGEKESLGHFVGLEVYKEVKQIMQAEEDYRKPEISEEPAAAGFVGSA